MKTTVQQVTNDRARYFKARADIEELKAASLRGELASKKDVHREQVATYTRLRARLLAVRSRVGQQLPHLTKSDLAIIDNEIRAALTELAEGARE